MLQSNLQIRSNLPVDLGNVLTWEVDNESLSITLENGHVCIQFFTSQIVRTLITVYGQIDTNPYSVILERQSGVGSIEDSENHLYFSSQDLKIKVSKYPFSLAILSSDGVILSEDNPGFGYSIQGNQIAHYRKMQNGERFLGLGEKTGHLDRRGSGYQNWNTDKFAYGSDTDPLYASIPFFIGVHNGKSYGYYLDNSYQTSFNFGASNNRFSSISANDGSFDSYFIGGNSVKDIISNFTQLTGRMPLPPIWSLGYQQCRYSYYPQREVIRIAEKFREKNIPADVIVLDIHYMDQYKIFSWDGKKFPDPQAMINHLKDLGFEVVVICDPGIKVEEGYDAYDSGVEKDIFLKYPDGSPYTGMVWPGWCHFPDFTKKSARHWWKEKLQFYTESGIKGYWNDMNEIATWGNMLPDNIIFDFEGDGGSTLKGRNTYGFQMSRASYESAKDLINERPFVLTRSGFAGVQRFSALWTGDNVSTDESMMLGVRLVNSLGLSGVAFCGYDIGGFVGNANGDLFARWMQLGAFSPFFRGHTMINSNSSEPWSFGESVEDISANFIRLRYKLLPYLYSTFREASETGIPINRSMAINYTHDDRVYNHAFEHQYFFGASILVAPLESTKSVQKVFLPDGHWFELFSGKKYEGNSEVFAECGIERLPVYVKHSSVLLLYPNIGRNTSEIGDTLELHLYEGWESTTITYYEDDGRSFDFENDGYYERQIHFQPSNRQLVISSAIGSFQSKIKTIKVVLHGVDSHSANVNNQSISTQIEDYRFIQPISNFDPFMKPEDVNLKNENLTTFNFPNENAELHISY